MPQRKNKAKAKPKIKLHWINPNPEHKGRLIAYVHDKFGEDGFTQTGRIKKSVLTNLVHQGDAIQPYNHMAQFALNANKT